MLEPEFGRRLEAVREVVAAQQATAGLDHPVRIIAVTKTFGPEAVRLAHAAGLQDVGENRVGEALAKQEACQGLPVAWHFIGGLQSRKTREMAARFALIHSVDRLNLATALNRRLHPGGTQDVLVQVNCSDEPQKGGVAPEELPRLLDGIATLPTLTVRGLMTMAAFDAPERAQRETFALLRTLRDAARDRGHPMTELSMGMSEDYGAAVREGATMLRLGSGLFGPRDNAHPVTAD